MHIFAAFYDVHLFLKLLLLGLSRALYGYLYRVTLTVACHTSVRRRLINKHAEASLAHSVKMGGLSSSYNTGTEPKKQTIMITL